MKIIKGDKVVIISGKDRGKSGTVTEAFPKRGLVLIEGVNMKKKHQRPRGRNARRGQILEKAHPIHVSNVMLQDPKGGKGTRVGIVRKGNERVRIAKKSGQELAK
ncbi:MAG: 50S ribosomal protein L24 [Patescibacteria group bacterium]